MICLGQPPVTSSVAGATVLAVVKAWLCHMTCCAVPVQVFVPGEVLPEDSGVVGVGVQILPARHLLNVRSIEQVRGAVGLGKGGKVAGVLVGLLEESEKSEEEGVR